MKKNKSIFCLSRFATGSVTFSLDQKRLGWGCKPAQLHQSFFSVDAAFLAEIVIT
jgi:hypothetical protein